MKLLTDLSSSGKVISSSSLAMNDAYPLQTRILRTIGVLLILIGGIATYYGPMEWTCFYFFSEHDRFAYEGLST